MRSLKEILGFDTQGDLRTVQPNKSPIDVNTVVDRRVSATPTLQPASTPGLGGRLWGAFKQDMSNGLRAVKQWDAAQRQETPVASSNPTLQPLASHVSGRRVLSNSPSIMQATGPTAKVKAGAIAARLRIDPNAFAAGPPVEAATTPSPTESEVPGTMSSGRISQLTTPMNAAEVGMYEPAAGGGVATNGDQTFMLRGTPAETPAVSAASLFGTPAAEPVSIVGSSSSAPRAVRIGEQAFTPNVKDMEVGDFVGMMKGLKAQGTEAETALKNAQISHFGTTDQIATAKAPWDIANISSEIQSRSFKDMIEGQITPAKIENLRSGSYANVVNADVNKAESPSKIALQNAHTKSLLEGIGIAKQKLSILADSAKKGTVTVADRKAQVNALNDAIKNYSAMPVLTEAQKLDMAQMQQAVKLLIPTITTHYTAVNPTVASE